jgi:DNA-binding XRE family transcriptional regulator
VEPWKKKAKNRLTMFHHDDHIYICDRGGRSWGFGSGGGLTVDDRGGGRVVQMTPDEIRGARVLLGLSQSQLAELLETDAQTVRRMEMDQNRSTHRLPAPRMCRLIMAYVDGYRPDDWPWEV